MTPAATAAAVAAVLELDEQWFDEHPHATYLYRPLIGAELAAFHLTDDRRWWVRVDRHPSKTYSHVLYRKTEQEGPAR